MQVPPMIFYRNWINVKSADTAKSGLGESQIESATTGEQASETE
jgi:hypothetical protein